jgi:NHLM bacteriocin system ABC transporter peptidase/ATP-binding protein
MRVRTRPILQIEAVECGAAALGIILDYFGRRETAPRLRTLCQTGRDGSAAAAILRAARECGLAARAWRCDTEQLRTLNPPFIVFWEFNHYVVVEGIGRAKVFVNDPAWGRRAVPMAEFDSGFSGVALTFEKGPAFQKGGPRPSAWRSLRRRLHGQSLGLCFVMLSTLALVFPSMVAAVLPKVFFDSMLDEGAAHWLHPTLAVMAVTAVLLGALAVLQQRALARLEANLAVQSASEFFWHLLRLPIAFFGQRHPGDLVETVSANDRVAGLLAGEVATNLVNALLVGVYLVLMYRYDATLTAIVLATAAANAAALHVVARKRSEHSQQIAKGRSRLFGAAVAGMNAIETLKAMGAEGQFFDQWTRQHGELMSAEQRMQTSHIGLSAISPLLSSLGAAAVLVIGGLRIMDGWLTLGMLVAFQTLMAYFLAPFQRLLNLGARLQQIHGDLCRLDDVLDTPIDAALNDDVQGRSELRLRGEIELRDVSFSYAGQPPLLQAFNLRIRAGSRVALVGRSGSGKSTAAKLLAGLYQPCTGEILLDGIRREELPRDLVTGSISMVDQDIALYSGSVAENIALMDDTLPGDDVIHAARDAAIHGDIVARPGGYSFELQPMGRNLSGGQKQRIDIARALATNPRILILDEATCALDPLTEREVLDNLRRRGCTCIVVAHRLSAIRACDEVVVLEGGRVVEHGTHQELLQREGTYAQLVA